MFRPQINFQSWNELPDLEIDGKKFIETWQKSDVLFGPGCDGKTLSGVMRYIYPALKVRSDIDFNRGTYRGYFGEFVGYPTNKFLEGSGSVYHEYDTPYQPDLARTSQEISFKKQLEGSRYSPIMQHCTGSNRNEALSRVSKSSKALLEYCLFEPHIKKIHFVLDDLNFELIIKEKSANETQKPSYWKSGCSYFKPAKEINKGNSYTSHELRLLHRLALLYPDLVQQKVICWYQGNKTQLPAKSHSLYKCWDSTTCSYREIEFREFWKCYDPKLEKCQRNPMYTQVLRRDAVMESDRVRRFEYSKL